MDRFEAEFGYVTPLGEVPEVSTSLLEILPGRAIQPHSHKRTREVELVISGEIVVDGVKKRAGEVMVWETQHVHGYENAGDSVALVLCIATPAYDPDDSFPASDVRGS